MKAVLRGSGSSLTPPPAGVGGYSCNVCAPPRPAVCEMTSETISRPGRSQAVLRGFQGMRGGSQGVPDGFQGGSRGVPHRGVHYDGILIFKKYVNTIVPCGWKVRACHTN